MLNFAHQKQVILFLEPVEATGELSRSLPVKTLTSRMGSRTHSPMHVGYNWSGSGRRDGPRMARRERIKGRSLRFVVNSLAVPSPEPPQSEA